MSTLQVVSASNAPAAIGPYSHGIQAGGFVFTSGQLPIDPKVGKLVEGEIEAQTEQALANLKAVLEAGGSSLGKVVKTTVFLKDLADFAKMNAVYEKAFAPHKPARTTIQAAKLPLDARVEIEAVGQVG